MPNITSRVSIAGGLLLASLLLVACTGSEEQTGDFDRFLAQAESSIERGDPASAIIELKNALQLQGDHLGARARLASLYLAQGEYASAEKEFRFVRSQGGTPDLYLIGLCDALLHMNRWQQVLDNADPGRAASLAPADHARVLALRGSAYIGLERLEAAREAFEQALAIHEKSIPAWLGQAALAVGEGRRATARLLIGQALPEASGADLVETWRLTAELERLEGRSDAAEAAYGRALELDSTGSLPIRLARVQHRLESGDLDGAREDLDSIPPRHQKHPHVLYARGLLAVQERRFTEASEHLQELRNSDPNHVFGLYYLGIAYLGMDQPEKAEPIFVQAAALAPRSFRIAFMLGQTRFRLGRHGDAARVLEPLLAVMPDDPRLQSLLGSVYLAQGKTEHGRQLLEQAVLQRPGDAQERIRFGLSLLEMGEHEPAIAELEKAAAQAEHPAQALVALITAYIRDGRHDAARREVARMQEGQPQEASHWNLLGLVETAAGNLEAARQAFARALELRPELASARYNLGRHHLRSGNPEEARQSFARVLQYHPDHLTTLMTMAGLEAENGQREAALRYATRARDRHPDELAPRLWLARHYLAVDEPGEALSQLQAVQARYADNPGFLGVLGEAQLLAGKTADAVASFRELVRITPRQAIAHYMLARACAMNRSHDCLRESLVTALGLDDGYPGMLELVHHAIALNNEPSSVGKLLWRLQHAAPDNLPLIQLRAGFALRQDRFGEAMAILEGALERFPGEWSLQDMTARSLARNGDPNRALAGLESWLGRHPADVRALLLVGMIQAEREDQPAAIRTFEQVLDSHPDHPQALNNLAWLLREQDLERARGYAERAHGLEPGHITRDTLGHILFLAGEYGRAEELLRSAFSEQPHSPLIRFHLAQVLVERQQREEARGLLKELLGGDQPFAEREQAEALLESLEG